jgi:microcystin-dependent protein
MAIYDVSTSEKKTSPSLVAGGTLWADSPIGTILAYGGTSAPAGWMICDGTSLLRASYPELFAVIGTAFGSADSTHFNIPDMTGKTAMGVETDHALGASENGALPNVKSNESQSLWAWNKSNSTGYNGAMGVVTLDQGYHATTEGASGRFGTFVIDASKVSNIYKNSQTKVDPANVRVNYIIKAKMVAIPSDFLSAVDETINENAKSPISSSNKLVTESDLNKAITVTTPDNNIVIADSRLITDNLVMVSGYIKNGTQLAFNTSQVQIGKLSVSGRTIRGSGPCSLFLFSNDLFGTNGPNTIPAIWKTAQGWLSIGIDVTNNPRLYEDSWFTAMLPLE